MKAGRASKTAELVCMGRAMAHGSTSVARFSDPTALTLLPASARARAERIRAGAAPTTLRERFEFEYLRRQSTVMVARTVAIDDSIRGATAPQLVLLGAGLDGRAWRLAELRDVVVFEVDHPDTQRDKRIRTSTLTQTAREVRFVPVDFERDELAGALEKAGHDPGRATTWIWEGVVMYLTAADVEATLAVIARRSAPGSRIVIAYHGPALVLRLVGLLLRRIGEPLRSTFRAGAMRALLAKYGFEVVADDDVHAIGSTLSQEIELATRPVKHMRIVTADRQA